MENQDLQRRMIEELAQGHEWAKQLQRSLEEQPSSTSDSLLAKKVLTSFTNVLSLVKSREFWTSEPGPLPLGVTDSPRSVSSSPPSEIDDKNSGLAFREQERRNVCKKRKTLPKWTEHVTINGETGPDGPLDDGYSWRKYGQKDILGAKHPRGYYRCTHKYAQGCEATKQVQKSDRSPLVFDITYRGKHTCNQSAQIFPSMPFPETQQQPPHEQLLLQPQLLLNFKTGLKVKTEGLDAEPTTESSFSFPLTPGTQQQQQHSFDQLISCSVSPSFVSPSTTSDSNYYMFSCGMEQPHLHTSESDLTDIISAATSVTNSPIVDIDFPLENLELCHDLSFDVADYF